METIRWEVAVSAPPEVLRACKKCGAKTAHLSSGLFRVNARKKSLDIWLIYRCARCKTTWNLPVFSRIGPKSIPGELLEDFLKNDPALALRCGLDMNLLRRNGAECALPPFEITGPAADLSREIRVKIGCETPLKIRLQKILRQKLGLSARSFEKAVLSGKVRLENGGDLSRAMLQKEITVILGGGHPES